jgi:hypothetical protein
VDVHDFDVAQLLGAVCHGNDELRGCRGAAVYKHTIA